MHTYTVQNTILGTGYCWPPFFAPAIRHQGYYYAENLTSSQAVTMQPNS